MGEKVDEEYEVLTKIMVTARIKADHYDTATAKIEGALTGAFEDAGWGVKILGSGARNVEGGTKSAIAYTGSSAFPEGTTFTQVTPGIWKPEEAPVLNDLAGSHAGYTGPQHTRPAETMRQEEEER